MTTLYERTPAASFRELIKVNNLGTGFDSTLRSIEDGSGISSPLQLSTSKIGLQGLVWPTDGNGAGKLLRISSDGTNLEWLSLKSDTVPEGTTNLYYTDARALNAARAAISATSPLSYSSTTGVISFTAATTGSGSGDFKSDGSVPMTGPLTIGKVKMTSVVTPPMTQTTPFNVFTFPASNTAVKLFVKVVEVGTANVQISEILVTNDGSMVYQTPYGVIATNGELGSFDFTIDVNAVTLQFTALTVTPKVITVSMISLI